MNELHETIREIKSRFRLFMNGVISQSMREKGMGYKLNFGIEYPRIKEIAVGYEKNHELAQALWKEDIRECKIMAGLVQPTETFYPEIAEIWMEDMRYPELAEYTVMNLFQYLPYAPERVFRWIADERPYFQLCGFLLMARLLMRQLQLNDRGEAELLDQAVAAVEDTGQPFVRKAALTALRKLALSSDRQSREVLRQAEIWQQSARPEMAAIGTSLKEELAG